MARITNTKREVVVRSMAEVEKAVHGMNKALRQEVDNSGELDTSFKAGRDAEAKALAVKIIKVIRWLKEDYFGITGNTPSAYTNAQIDAINPDIRTHDED